MSKQPAIIVDNVSMKYSLSNDLITKQQMEEAKSDRKKQLRLMSKAVAHYLNRDSQ